MHSFLLANSAFNVRLFLLTFAQNSHQRQICGSRRSRFEVWANRDKNMGIELLMRSCTIAQSAILCGRDFPSR